MEQRIIQLILISFLTLLGHLSSGQVTIGMRGGANLTNGTFNETLSGTRVALGIHAGLISNIELHKKVYLQPQLQYSLQGWSLNHLVKGSRMSLHYLNFPILIGYKLLSNLSLLTGPQVGMLLKTIVQPESSIDFNKLYRKVDIGLAIGASYHLTSKVGLDLRYIHGLTYLAEATLTDANGNPDGTVKDGYNRVFQIGLTYLLGKK